MSAISWFLVGVVAALLVRSVAELVRLARSPWRSWRPPELPPATLVPPAPELERRRVAAQLLAGGAFECGCPSCRAWRRGGFVQ